MARLFLKKQNKTYFLLGGNMEIKGLPKSIKILTYNTYGGYGSDIPQMVIDYIQQQWGQEFVDYWFKDGWKDGYSGKHIKHEKLEESRTSTVLISAFEEYIKYRETKKYDTWREAVKERCNYTINELTYSIEYDYYDGIESGIKIMYL